MSVFAVAGGKGGVGKSTTVASLGVTLHRSGLSVALVDADLAMPNLADLLGEGGDAGIHGVLAGDASLDDVLVEVADGLDLVPGGRTIERFEAADPANLREVIDPLAAASDVVLVDTGAGLNHETLVATGLADGTVLVTTPQSEAVADVAKTAEFVAHAEATVLGAVVTRVDGETDLGRVADRLGVPLLGAVPADPAVGTGPATDGDAGEAYERLAATVTASLGADGGSIDAPASVAWTTGSDRGVPSATASETASADD